MKTKQQLTDEIVNFIEYYSSNENEREDLKNALNDYLSEVYQEPKEVMVFTYDVRKGEEIYWKKAVGDLSPTSEYFPADELHKWVKKYKQYNWQVIIN